MRTLGFDTFTIVMEIICGYHKTFHRILGKKIIGNIQLTLCRTFVGTRHACIYNCKKSTFPMIIAYIIHPSKSFYLLNVSSVVFVTLMTFSVRAANFKPFKKCRKRISCFIVIVYMKYFACNIMKLKRLRRLKELFYGGPKQKIDYTKLYTNI